MQLLIARLQMLGIVLTLLLIAWSLLRLARRRPLAGEPRCAVCQFILIGVPTERCPECGATYPVTGVRAGSARFRWSRFVAFSLVMLVAAFYTAQLRGGGLRYYTFEGTDDMAFGPPNAFRCSAQYASHGFRERTISTVQTMAVKLTAGAEIATVSRDYSRGVWVLTPSDASRRLRRELAGGLAQSDIDALFAVPLDAPDADGVTRFLNAASVPWSPLAPIEVEAFIAGHNSRSGGGGSSEGSRPILDGVAFAWLCAAAWALALNFLNLWEPNIRFGRDALLQIGAHVPARKTAASAK